MRLSVSTLDLQTGVVVDNFETKPKGRISTNCDARFCISSVRGSAFAKVGGKRKLQQFFGVSKGYGGEIRSASNRIVRVLPRASKARALLQAKGRSTMRSPAAAQLTIGVPGSGFTANKELTNLIGSPSNLASTVVTTLVQSPCYRADGSYSVLEVDPRLLAERKKELDLVKKGYVKGDPSFRDQYTRPENTVRGSVSQNGDSASATLQITNKAGQVIASSSSTTASGGWFEALNRAALDLAGQLCEGPKVNIALAQCFLRECSCGSNSTGYRIELRVEGTAKLPVGAIMYVSVPESGTVTRNCGGVTPSSFGSALACQRTSEAQPESFEYNLASLDPRAPSCSCPRDGAPQSFSFIATALSLVDGSRDDALANDVPCVVTQ
jgi:hypothetical protein